MVDKKDELIIKLLATLVQQAVIVEGITDALSDGKIVNASFDLGCIQSSLSFVLRECNREYPEFRELCKRTFEDLNSIYKEKAKKLMKDENSITG